MFYLTLKNVKEKKEVILNMMKKHDENPTIGTLWSINIKGV